MGNESDLLAELRRHNLLISLIQHRIIAEAVDKYQVSEDELSTARDQFMRNQNLLDDNMLKKFLVKQGWGEDDFLWQISLPIKISMHCEKNFAQKSEAYFLKRKNQLDQVVYSLLRVKDRLLANELYWRIKEGEANFGDLAETFAEGPERNTKGIVGPVSMSQAHPVLAEALRTSKPGELMKPIQIEEWTIVARLETYSPATFDKGMAARLSRELFDQWIGDEVRRRMSEIICMGANPGGE